MLPVLVTVPVIGTDGMVVTTLPVAQLHVPLLPAAADIAAVPTASALAYLSALGGNGSSENTGQIRCGIVRSGGALLRGKHGTPCRGTCCGSRRHAWNGTCCSRHHICGVPSAAVPYAAVVPSVAVLEAAVSPNAGYSRVWVRGQSRTSQPV